MRLDNTQPTNWPTKFKALHASANNEELKAFYAAGSVKAATPINQVPLVALDFETTGLNSQQDEIVSIGLVPFNTHRIYCRHAKHWIVNPASQLTERSIIIHQITHSDIGSAPDLQEILKALLHELAGKIVVVHYRFIERDFLYRALMQRIGEGIEFPVIDTMALEKRILLQQRSFKEKLLGLAPTQSIRLPDSRQRYNLPAYKLHHAMTDALATAELLQAQIAHHYQSDVRIDELWC